MSRVRQVSFNIAVTGAAGAAAQVQNLTGSFASLVTTAHRYQATVSPFVKASLAAGVAMTAVRALAGAMMDLAGGSIEFNKALTGASILMEDQGRSFNRLKESALSMAATYGASLQEITAAQQLAIGSGAQTVAAQQHVVSSAVMLAKSGFAETRDTVNGIMAVTNAYGMNAEASALQVADALQVVVNRGTATMQQASTAVGQFAGAAATAGVSYQDAMAAFAAGTLVVGAERAATSLSNALKAISNPGKQARDVAKELGIEWNAAALSSKGFIGVLDQLVGLSGLTVEKLQQLVPEARGYRLVAGLLADDLAKLKDITNSTNDSLGTAIKSYQQYSKTDAAALERSQAAWENLKRTLGDVLLKLIGISKFAPDAPAVPKEYTWGANQADEQKKLKKEIWSNAAETTLGDVMSFRSADERLAAERAAEQQKIDEFSERQLAIQRAAARTAELAGRAEQARVRGGPEIGPSTPAQAAALAQAEILAQQLNEIRLENAWQFGAEYLNLTTAQEAAAVKAVHDGVQRKIDADVSAKNAKKKEAEEATEAAIKAAKKEAQEIERLGREGAESRKQILADWEKRAWAIYTEQVAAERELGAIFKRNNDELDARVTKQIAQAAAKRKKDAEAAVETQLAGNFGSRSAPLDSVQRYRALAAMQRDAQSNLDLASATAPAGDDPTGRLQQLGAQLEAVSNAQKLAAQSAFMDLVQNVDSGTAALLRQKAAAEGVEAALAGFNSIPPTYNDNIAAYAKHLEHGETALGRMGQSAGIFREMGNQAMATAQQGMGAFGDFLGGIITGSEDAGAAFAQAMAQMAQKLIGLIVLMAIMAVIAQIPYVGPIMTGLLGIGAAFKDGGLVKKMAAGGNATGQDSFYVSKGRGLMGQDSVRALLMPGERVLSVRENQHFESLMTNLAQANAAPRATGQTTVINNYRVQNNSILPETSAAQTKRHLRRVMEHS